jgi:hypothetical protein
MGDNRLREHEVINKIVELLNNKDYEDSLKTLDIHFIKKGNKKHDM